MSRAGAQVQQATRRLESMLTIRRFEEQLIRLHQQGAFPGHYHVYIGQEATAVAACEALGPGDYVFTTHRNHGHLLARGAAPERMLAEVLGRVGGYNRGRGGTLHLAAADLNVPTTSALVGGNVPLATGAALGLKELGLSGAVVVAFFGDGVLEEGAFYEAINLGSLWKVPVVYVCENNSVPPELRRSGQYPSSTHSASQLADVPRAFGIPAEVADGADMEGLAELFGRLVGEVRREGTPRFVEVRSSRWPGNFGLWPELVGGETDLAWAWGERQPPAELAEWVQRSDPLLLYARAEVERGELTPAQLVEMDGRVRERIRQAAQFALSSPYPEPAEAYAGVFAGERR